MAVLRANVELEPDEKIDFVSVFSGDPRLKILEKLVGTNDPYQFPAPTLVMERKVISKSLIGAIKSHGMRAMVHAINSEGHYYTLIRNFQMIN